MTLRDVKAVAVENAQLKITVKHLESQQTRLSKYIEKFAKEQYSIVSDQKQRINNLEKAIKKIIEDNEKP